MNCYFNVGLSSSQTVEMQLIISCYRFPRETIEDQA